MRRVHLEPTRESWRMGRRKQTLCELCVTPPFFRPCRDTIKTSHNHTVPCAELKTPSRRRTQALLSCGGHAVECLPPPEQIPCMHRRI